MEAILLPPAHSSVSTGQIQTEPLTLLTTLYSTRLTQLQLQLTILQIFQFAVQNQELLIEKNKQLLQDLNKAKRKLESRKKQINDQENECNLRMRDLRVEKMRAGIIIEELKEDIRKIKKKFILNEQNITTKEKETPGKIMDTDHISDNNCHMQELEMLMENEKNTAFKNLLDRMVQRQEVCDREFNQKLDEMRTKINAQNERIYILESKAENCSRLLSSIQEHLRNRSEVKDLYEESTKNGIPSIENCTIFSTQVQTEALNETTVMKLVEDKDFQNEARNEVTYAECFTSYLEKKNYQVLALEEQMANNEMRCEEEKNIMESDKKLKQHQVKALVYLIENVTNQQALHKAIDADNIEALQILLEAEAGLNIEATDDYGLTPLQKASNLGSLEIVTLLLNHGAQVNVPCPTFENRTALHIASYKGHVEVATKLLDNNADIEARTALDSTPLYMAAWKGQVNTTELLLERGAFVNAPRYRNDNSTPLHVASLKGYTEVAEVLLNHGADIEARTSTDFKTPLHWAAQMGQLETIKLLIHYKANIHAQKDNGETALQLAFRNKHVHVVEYLSTLTD